MCPPLYSYSDEVEYCSLYNLIGTGRGSEKEQSRCRFVRAMAVCFKVALVGVCITTVKLREAITLAHTGRHGVE